MTTTLEAKPLSDFWWLVLLRGLVKLGLGILLLAVPGKTLTVLIQFIGIFWLVAGLLSIVAIVIGYSRRHWFWTLLSGILGIVAGLLILGSPLISTFIIVTALVIIFGVLGIIKGVLGLIESFRGAGWYGIIWGSFNLIVGILLLIAPVFSVTVLVVVIGSAAIVGGLLTVWHAFQMRRS